jgi:hypothetical protein
MSNVSIKQLFFGILLLNFYQGFAQEVPCTQSDESNLCLEAQEIKHKLIKIVDGTAKANVRQLEELKDDIKALRDGIDGKGLIPCEGKAYSLKQLAIAEHDQLIAQKDMPVCLENALNKFEEKSDAYLKQARGFKQLMLDIINQWSKQRNKPESILLKWGSQPAGTEHAEMRKMITSFIMLDHFLGDLACFLNDFRFTCKKSSKIYEDWKAKNEKSSHK